MDYKLIAIDIDDTLLTSKKTITDRNKAAIKRALDQGIKIVLCSGRTHNAMTEYTDELGITGSDQYMITNGGGIIENMAGDIIAEELMSNDFYREFVDFVHEHDLQYNVVDNQGNTYTSHRDWISASTIIQAFENDNGLYLREPSQMPADFQIVKAIINGTKEEIDNISETVHQHYDKDYFVVRTGVGFLEIFSQHVNKGAAVKTLAQKLGIDLSQVITLGDRENDIPMLEIAGKGIAMDNALPTVKEVADEVTADNDHSGVGLAIEKFALD